MARVSIFFLILGKEFLDYRESRLTRPPDNRPIVSGILSPVAQRLLSVDRLLLYGCRGPHTRHADADAAKQRTVAYQSGRGRGNRCFCRCELITIVAPLSWPGSAKTAASVCLCSVYRKQERSLFTAALEQTSNVSTAGLWSPIPGIRSAMASLRCAARLHFDRCTTAPETRPLPAVSRAHPPRRRPIVQRCPPFTSPPAIQLRSPR